MNPMQKKKLISIAIALTLQSYYIPAIAAENNDDEKECPSNISSLPKEKRAKLSPTCLATPENDNHWGWVAGGVAALVAGVAIGVENNGGGDSNHSYTPPTPDNGGDDNVNHTQKTKQTQTNKNTQKKQKKTKKNQKKKTTKKNK
ncbi:hypothetical protein, partial [Salmonella enterica]|uniref:hypothetical protein n=1 Tax=Salmonella enterica TaxID=28901 RepID=UPI001F1CEBDF